jgi:hypothetical protein
VDAADAVLGMMVPPSAGTDGVPLRQLYAFAKVFLKAVGCRFYHTRGPI